MSACARRLTLRELEAISEALLARTAGEIDIDDPDAPTREDYESAADVILEMMARRSRP